MGKTLSAEFEFKIGDAVMHRDAGISDIVAPHKYIVVERVVQQCHGGVQALYLVRGVSMDGNLTQPFSICAFEAVAYPSESDLSQRRILREAQRKAEREAARAPGRPVSG